MRIIVIGVNHAGTSFLKGLAAMLPRGSKHTVVAYDRNDNISFLGCGIALWVDKTVNDPRSLFYASPETLARRNVTINMQHEVLSIDTDAKTLLVKNLKSGVTFKDKYDKLVYAAGSVPIKLNLPNEQAKNIFYVKLYQDAASIVEASSQGAAQTVAIIGAGYIGVELVEAFTKLGKTVHLIEVQDEILKTYFDHEFSAPLAAAMAKAKVQLHLDTKVESFVVDKTGVLSAIQTSRGLIQADLAIMASGFKPNVDLLPKTEKSKRGHIKVDGLARAMGVSDVYALGDAASYFHAVTNEHLSVGLATNAVKSGLVAAADIAKQTGFELASVVGTNGISVFGTNYAATGLCAIAAERRGITYASATVATSDLPQFMPSRGEVTCKILYDPTSLRLLGAQIASRGGQNHTDAIFMFALALQKGLKITELLFTDMYFLPHYNTPVNYIMQVILKALKIELEASLL